MTPLKLLSVGVIVVLVWMCGMRTAARHERGDSPDVSVVPFLLGLLAIATAISQLFMLGIKEAAK